MDDIDEIMNTEGTRTMSIDELKCRLSIWLSEARVTMRSSRSLLDLLRMADPNSVFAQLQKDPRSLLPKTFMAMLQQHES